jgi:sarcosine oxidase
MTTGFRRTIDVAVIGAGVLGLATTDALLSRGVEVRCFDGRLPGQGQSGGLTRTFRHRHDDPRTVALAVAARRAYRRWEERCGRRLVGDEGAVYAGMGPADVAGLVAQAVPHHFVPPELHHEVFGPLGPVDGPLLVDPSAGAIRARRTIEALTTWVTGHVVDADVHSVTDPGRGGVEIQTADAIYRARHVVICAGTAGPRLAATVGLRIPLACGLHARPQFRIRDAFRDTPLPCWVDRSGGFGETVYGSPVGTTGGYVVGLIGDGVDVPFTAAGGIRPGSAMEDHVRRVTEYVGRALPGLEPRPVGVRVCVMSKLPAGSDAVRAWHTPGVTAIAGHNLFKLAPVLGELLAEAAITDQLPAALAEIGDRALAAPERVVR